MTACHLPRQFFSPGERMRGDGSGMGKGPMKKDKNLVKRLKEKDPQAFTELVDLYGERVYNLALKILRNPDDAEDVFQETFTAVYEKIHTFNEQADLFTWIYRIATNFALMKIRQTKRETVTENELEVYENQPEFPVHLPGSYPDQVVLDEELQQELNRALDRIPEIYRTVFVLRDLENLSTAETAEVLNITESNVKVRLRRARLFLRDELCRYFERCQEESGNGHK
ncbi:MAG TPA: sigma-70 family RNA polymerase sigma factor [Bacteroidetes bacterium]|nr:sigma-70 family RNA polymerase sigma factor [Bacteroidota bacterium]